MFNFKTIQCTHCGAIICNLPEAEAKKLKNLTFQCEDCNHEIFFNGFEYANTCYSKYDAGYTIAHAQSVI